MTNRFVCIHGHFYQPPRENPWLETIEQQDSARPYRDWNERINAECYSTNSAARILNPERRIRTIINNYARISFNFGPTLLSWMQNNAPETYEAILEADRESIGRFSGHGSAIAQVYNHLIMPLANERDRRTQILWGLEDFTSRFGRQPEGMWLAETAVDTPTLELLAEYGIRYTVLAPRQASRYRPEGGSDWTDVSGGRIDTRKAYFANLPSGRTIDLFFYDGAIAQEIAFGTLLSNGENFAGRLLASLSPEPSRPELAHIATDGETYGHHHRNGDMALAYCLMHLDENRLARLTVYGEYLDIAPPRDEVEILENTSWSCSHGVERWRSDCGCGSSRPGWNQRWRKPLRDTFDWLRDSLAPFYESQMKEFTDDPWGVRNRYVGIILNRSSDNLETFFSSLGLGDDTPDEPETTHGFFRPLHEETTGGTRTAELPGTDRSWEYVKLKRMREKLIRLLELQRHLLLMYTSCGWFFEELSGIETVQTIEYAARAIQLAQELGLGSIENEFMDRLETIPGNIAKVKTGRRVYEQYVRPSIVDLYRVAAHSGISSLWTGHPENARVFSYVIEAEDYERMEAGRYRMVVGRARFRSVITLEEEDISFAFLHLGDHNLNGGVRKSRDMENYARMKDEMRAAFRRLSVSDIILLLDEHFGSHGYTLASLFREEARKVYALIMEPSLKSIDFSFRTIYDTNYPVMLSLVDAGNPLPAAIKTPVEFVINTDLRLLLEAEVPPDPKELRRLHDEAVRWSIALDGNALAFAATRRITSDMERIELHPFDIPLMQRTVETLRILLDLSIVPNLWKAQNILFSLWENVFYDVKEQVEAGNPEMKEQFDQFLKLEQLINSDPAM